MSEGGRLLTPLLTHSGLSKKLLRLVLYGSGSAYVVFFLCIYLPEKSQIPVLYGAENTPILALVPLCPKPVLYKIRGFFASPFS